MFDSAFGTMSAEDLKVVQMTLDKAVSLSSTGASNGDAIPQDRLWYFKDLLARLHHEQFDYSTAIALRKEHLSHVEQTSGTTSAIYFSSLRNLAKSLAANQQYSEAIDALEKAIDVARNGSLSDAQLTLALQELFTNVLASGDLTMLEPMQLELRDDLTRNFAKFPHYALRLASFESQSLYEQGESLEKSIEVMTQALNDFLQLPGKRVATAATLHLELIALSLEKDDFANAQIWLDKLVADESNYEYLGISYELRKDTLRAQLLIKQGRSDEALQILLPHHNELPNGDNFRPTYYFAHCLIGECYSLQGNRSQADQFLQAGIDGLQSKCHFYTYPKRWRERLLAECQRRLAEHQERGLNSAP
jgi:tetratricopeptide (TPR) repeat protein